MEVLVFLQGKQRRQFVGTLWEENDYYKFQYDLQYTRKSTLSMGPDLPLRMGVFQSTRLFSSFEDRIPSKQNPEYQAYCADWGISSEEENRLILLTTIGNRGPSSFLFRLKKETVFTGKELKRFRTELGLSVNDFALLVESEPSTINRTENNKIKSHLLLSFCEILSASISAIEYQLDKRGMYIHEGKIAKIKQFIHNRSKEEIAKIKEKRFI